MVGELFAEVGHEITADIGRFAVEVVQFLILVAAVWALTVGSSKRRGIITGRLADRRAALETRLEAAGRAEGALETARAEAQAARGAAEAQARQVVREARARAAALVKESHAVAEQRAVELEARAVEVLAAEHGDMQTEVRDRLIEVVADATRSIVNDQYTLPEQRALIQRAVIAGLERFERATSIAAESR
ncbi:MAG: hypothetical protein WC971_04850 [Coriobacteriia bacterium]